jgi:hypothetical protein
MKRFYPVYKTLFTAILLFAGSAFAQNNPGIVKGYAFSQESVPGMIPVDVPGENGAEGVKANTGLRTHYFAYLEIKASHKIEIKSVWINGRLHKANTGEVESPVVTSGEKGETVLIKKTSNSIISVTPGERTSGSASIPRSLRYNNKVVIVYSWKGKTYYYGIRQIKKLPQAQYQ